MGKALLGIFEIYRRSYEEAYRKALEGAKYLYDFDLVVIDSKDIVAREEIMEAVKRDGVCYV
jgi:hypothetical protein